MFLLFRRINHKDGLFECGMNDGPNLILSFAFLSFQPFAFLFVFFCFVASFFSHFA